MFYSTQVSVTIHSKSEKTVFIAGNPWMKGLVCWRSPTVTAESDALKVLSRASQQRHRLVLIYYRTSYRRRTRSECAAGVFLLSSPGGTSAGRPRPTSTPARHSYAKQTKNAENKIRYRLLNNIVSRFAAPVSVFRPRR